MLHFHEFQWLHLYSSIFCIFFWYPTLPNAHSPIVQTNITFLIVFASQRGVEQKLRHELVTTLRLELSSSKLKRWKSTVWPGTRVHLLHMYGWNASSRLIITSIFVCHVQYLEVRQYLIPRGPPFWKPKSLSSSWCSSGCQFSRTALNLS